MKKVVLGVLAIVAIVGSRPVAKRIGRKLREHCGRMAAQCQQMAGRFATRGEPVGRT